MMLQHGFWIEKLQEEHHNELEDAGCLVYGIKNPFQDASDVWAIIKPRPFTARWEFPHHGGDSKENPSIPKCSKHLGFGIVVFSRVVSSLP